MSTPIERMIDLHAQLRCSKCGANKADGCGCWEQCECGWWFETGGACRNPTHGQNMKGAEGD